MRVLSRLALKKAKKITTNILEIWENSLPTDSKYLEEYLIAKQEWENFQMIETNDIIMRSKAVWVEKGQKNSNIITI